MLQLELKFATIQCSECPSAYESCAVDVHSSLDSSYALNYLNILSDACKLAILGSAQKLTG